MADLIFRPLWGVGSDAAVCYMLEVGEFMFLLDCGWSDAFDPAMLEPLRRWVELGGA